MPTVTFQGSSMPAPRDCEYEPDGQTTILGLARRNDIPLYWRCGQGTCGACAARVTITAGAPRAMVSRERNVLLRERYPVEPTTVRANWRLTCGYQLCGEDLRVEW